MSQTLEGCQTHQQHNTMIQIHKEKEIWNQQGATLMRSEEFWENHRERTRKKYSKSRKIPLH